MLQEKTGIGPGLLFMVLYTGLFGYGVMQSPYVAARYMGNNGYWGFFLAFILAVGLIVLLHVLGKKFPQKSIIQYLPDVCGIIPGKILGSLYLLFIIFEITWTSSLIVQQSETYFLFRTPTSVLMLLYLGISAYIAHQGIEGITRLAAFVFPVTFVLIVLSVFFSFQNFELDNIRPIFFIDGAKIPRGTVQMFYPFFALSTVLMIHPYLTDKQQGLKTMLGAALLSFVIIFLVIISAIGNYSAPGVLRYGWPVIEVTRKANLPFLLQTFGLFFTASWLTLTLTATGLFYYVLAEGSAQLLSVLNYKWFTLILFPVIYFVMMLLFSGVIEVHYAFTYYRLIGFVLTLGLPFFVWILSVIKNTG